MGLKVGVVGAGQFAPSFYPLARHHPLVSEVSVTDLRSQRAEDAARIHHLDYTFPSFEAMLASDVDAVALFTQRWTHGPLAIQALEAGKHVYSTPPMGASVDEIERILTVTARSQLVYQMAETSYYYPASVYCRAQVQAGAFGRLVYAEADYLHDMDLGLAAAYAYSGGPGWKRTASWPPMLYATHSVGSVLSVTGGRAYSAVCFGIEDREGDGVFQRDISDWGNSISNAVGLFTLDGGAVMRLAEMRRIGYPSKIRESRLRLFGTEGSFEQSSVADHWQSKSGVEDVTTLLAVEKRPTTSVPVEAGGDYASRFAPVHDQTTLPVAYRNLPNGHLGSHQYLANDFFEAVHSSKQPPMNAWTAARYTLPGIVAHNSMERDGRRLSIPDFGDAPQ